ncbi:hypothetical protein [Curtobacterium flaccumfaciens]|uniref:hypothetical protein n=1 Tax=Curtobacterium flaccumfaciens TaxID=2035 RepID=UPI001BDEBC6A|nr:hypothetical protein [Curtobacterium flaccumfaciens]MBT1607039.1 hypothetical protein [Curtobacterium flaccumfaciens pv. betae]MBT1655167.1 hypothetical protein [Curtobacterium flaccumfaciens pv. betae]MCS0469754.1 hypothetical protein [Curtobacterium flaccumfaciens pv. betae]MCS0472920.1 hypothetical protein [Curtobacterium flaccumfaciens pv. betae]MCS0476602.1 hypothetical protein [Curtobacterium flaccumfaciens pv. betae]
MADSTAAEAASIRIATEQATTGRPHRVVTDCRTVLALLHVAARDDVQRGPRLIPLHLAVP